MGESFKINHARPLLPQLLKVQMIKSTSFNLIFQKWKQVASSIKTVSQPDTIINVVSMVDQTVIINDAKKHAKQAFF